ncbi:hypothetical protein LXA43DRAFT_1104098 [Ganoderma leucocontextum]|nr:hypothetical protein LXA43DRAFT_1104098 [Ganoderma leucocontextum]
MSRYRYYVEDLDLTTQSKYSDELRILCHIDARKRVPYPVICPRCEVVNTHFKMFMTYDGNKAGLWTALCFGCQKVHTPTQVGPPADLRTLINERVEHDLEHEHTAKKRRDFEKLMDKEAKTMKAKEKKAKAEKKAQTAGKQAEKRKAAHLAHLQEMRSGVQKKRASKKAATAPTPREIDIVFWTKQTTLPDVQTVKIEDPSRCELTSIPPIARLLDSDGHAEFWDMDDARWVPDVAPAQVDAGAPALLVRDTTVDCCVAFGFHVHLLQDGSASTAKERTANLKAAQEVRNEISRRVSLANDVWVVFWAEDDSRGQVIRVQLDAKRKVSLTSNAPLADLLKDAHEVHVWSVQQTDWKEYSVDEPVPANIYDTVLMRLSHVERMKFFGVEVERLTTRHAPLPSLHSLANGPRAMQPRAAQANGGDLTYRLPGTSAGAFDMYT